MGGGSLRCVCAGAAVLLAASCSEGHHAEVPVGVAEAPSTATAPIVDAGVVADVPDVPVDAGRAGESAPPPPDPRELPLTPEDLARTWTVLAVPHPAEGTRVVRGPDGFVVAWNESIWTKAGASASWDYAYQSANGITWHKKQAPKMVNRNFGVSGIAYCAGRYVLIASRLGAWVSTASL